MLKQREIFTYLMAVGLVLAIGLGGAGGSLAQQASSGGLSPEKAYRDSSDRFPDPFIGGKGVPDNTPGSTLSPDKAARDGSDQFPDPFLEKKR